jgi:hypothetical protein
VRQLSRLALTFIVVTVALLAPAAHAQIPQPECWMYWDAEGLAILRIDTAGRLPNGDRYILVTLGQNGVTYTGRGVIHDGGISIGGYAIKFGLTAPNGTQYTFQGLISGDVGGGNYWRVGYEQFQSPWRISRCLVAPPGNGSQ